jgi:hypothetical protein
MRSARHLALAFGCLVLAAAPARAEQPTGQNLYEGKCKTTPTKYQEVNALYHKGRWGELQKQARTLIATCSFVGGPQPAPDLKRDYISLVIVGKNLKSEPVGLDFLVHEPELQPYSRTIPGLQSAAPSPSESQSEVQSATTNENEPRFYELFIGPSDGYKFYAQYFIERVADPVAGQTAGFLKQAFDLGSILTALADRSEKEPVVDLPAVLVEVDLPFNRATISAEHRFDIPIPDDPETPEREPPLTLNPTVTYRNTPLRRWTYGLLAGGVAWSKARDRAKVESNVLSADPLPPTLTMAIVNVHPKPYDESRPRMSSEERLRFFGGTVLTPGFGVGAGVGVGLVRGFAVNAGATAFLTRRLREGDSFGAAPRDENQAMRLGLGTAVFLGVSYGLE